MSSFVNGSTRDQVSQASYRMEDETKVVEKLVSKLVRQVDNLENVPSSLPEHCITIPRRLSNSATIPNPACYLTGQVWRWGHLPTDFVMTTAKLKPLPFCLSRNYCMEICLNPNHYKSSTNLLMTPHFTQPWASLAYHEKGRRVGDIFQCQTPMIYVQSTGIDATDGVCFHLDKLPKPEDPVTAHRRHQIGNGVLLIYAMSQVCIQSSSDSDVFIQAKFYNRMKGYHKNSVFRLRPHCSDHIRVMRDDDFHNYLNKQIEKGVEAIYEMANMCSIRIAFAERWNGRTPITEINCWMEIKFKRHLSWMDTVLRQMGAPYKLHF